MNSWSKQTSPERLALWALVLAALAVRLGLAWQPLERLLVMTVSDDMFYYLKLAQNWVAGLGVTFDGQNPTNGFHPLFFLAAAALFKAGAGQEAAVHLLLMVSSLCGLGTAWLIRHLVLRITNEAFLGLLGFALYAFNPFALALEFNGLETALYGMLLMATLVAYLDVRQQPAVRWPRWLGVGALAGLTFLARTEGIFLPAVMVLDFAWLALRKRLPAGHWQGLGLGLLAGLAVASPWLIWNLAQFGTIEQASGKIFPLRAQLILERTLGRLPGLGDHVQSALRSLAWNIYILASMLLGIPYTASKRVVLFFAVVPALAAGYLLGRGRGQKQAGRAMDSLAPALGYIALLFAYYSFYHRASHWRYFYSLLLVLIPTGAALLAGWKDSLGATAFRRFAGLGALVVYLLAASWILIVREPSFPHQARMAQAAHWMKQNLPGEARIGAFNAGIMGYFSGRRVVNLDGVVNNAMPEVIINRRLDGYIQSEHLTHVCDSPEAVELYFRLFAEHPPQDLLVEEQVFGDPVHAPGQAVSVYRIKQDQPAAGGQ
ncbi:MAG: glycosyltransferase family 39 protein [candidate division FCPU426 bacterium]